MYGVLLLVLVAVVSLLVTRFATVALTVTGMARQSARFQARSALTGVGFTTSESENIVNHPVRRRIVMTLMLVSNLGIVTAVASLLSGFAGAGTGGGLLRAALLLSGLVAVYVLSLSPWVDRQLSRAAARFLNRFTDIEVRDFARLLHLAGNYSVKEVAAQQGDWMADRPLAQLRLRDEGVVVLGIVRHDGTYLGAPDGETSIRPGDTVILYGRDDVLEELDQRPAGAAGDDAHLQSRAAQREVERRQHAEHPA